MDEKAFAEYFLPQLQQAGLSQQSSLLLLLTRRVEASVLSPSLRKTVFIHLVFIPTFFSCSMGGASMACCIDKHDQAGTCVTRTLKYSLAHKDLKTCQFRTMLIV